MPLPPRQERTREEGKKKSLVQLIGEVPGLLSQLLKDEIAQIKQELGEKAKKLGLGAGLFAGAAFFGFFAFAVFLAVAILVLAIWLPAWAAALIVLVILLILAAVLALLGLREVKKGVPPTPEESIKSVKDDVRAIKGMGKYDR